MIRRVSSSGLPLLWVCLLVLLSVLLLPPIQSFVVVPPHSKKDTHTVGSSITRVNMGPPLPPTQCGTSLNPTNTHRPSIQIECFLDLICPFSAKMFLTLYRDVIPSLSAGDNDISFTIHQVIQPWHPQGTMVHEAALAVKRVAPEAYGAYVEAVYSAFTENGAFKDESTWKKTRLEIYDDLLQLLEQSEVLKKVNVASVKALLMPTGAGGNEGNAMTQEIKWACKLHRTRGVHVTPTVFVNGLEAGVVSSGWTSQQWMAFLEPRGKDNFQAASL